MAARRKTASEGDAPVAAAEDLQQRMAKCERLLTEVESTKAATVKELDSSIGLGGVGHQDMELDSLLEGAESWVQAREALVRRGRACDLAALALRVEIERLRSAVQEHEAQERRQASRELQHNALAAMAQAADPLERAEAAAALAGARRDLGGATRG